MFLLLLNFFLIDIPVYTHWYSLQINFLWNWSFNLPLIRSPENNCVKTILLEIFLSKIWVFFLSLWLLFAPIDTVFRIFSSVTDISIYTLLTKFMFLSFNIVAVYTQWNDLHIYFRWKRCFKVKHFCRIYIFNFDHRSSPLKLTRSTDHFNVKTTSNIRIFS